MLFNTRMQSKLMEIKPFRIKLLCSLFLALKKINFTEEESLVTKVVEYKTRRFWKDLVT